MNKSLVVGVVSVAIATMSVHTAYASNAETCGKQYGTCSNASHAVYTYSMPEDKPNENVPVIMTSVPVLPVPTVIITPNTPQDAPDETEEPNVKHCNNGEGNGAEGCSPANSDNANNDEDNEHNGKGKKMP